MACLGRGGIQLRRQGSGYKMSRAKNGQQRNAEEYSWDAQGEKTSGPKGGDRNQRHT